MTKGKEIKTIESAKLVEKAGLKYLTVKQLTDMILKYFEKYVRVQEMTLDELHKLLLEYFTFFTYIDQPKGRYNTNRYIPHSRLLTKDQFIIFDYDYNNKYETINYAVCPVGAQDCCGFEVTMQVVHETLKYINEIVREMLVEFPNYEKGRMVDTLILDEVNDGQIFFTLKFT